MHIFVVDIFSSSKITSTFVFFQWLLHSANHQSPQHCHHDAVSRVSSRPFLLIVFWIHQLPVCPVCSRPPLPLHLPQSDCHHNVLWSCRAGVSGDVPVCGLWREHHLCQRDGQDVHRLTARWVTPPLSSTAALTWAVLASFRWFDEFFLNLRSLTNCWHHDALCFLQYHHQNNLHTKIRTWSNLSWKWKFFCDYSPSVFLLSGRAVCCQLQLILFISLKMESAGFS